MSTLAVEKSISFKNILVATDFSDASRHALACAAGIAGASEAELFVVHALPVEARLPVPLDPWPATLDRPVTEAKQHMAELESLESLRRVRHQQIVERGPVSEVVLDAIERNQIDLLVLGTHGRTGLKKMVLGSVTEELFRCAPCPVLTVGPFAALSGRIRRVLFATDFGPASLQALPYAVDFANKAEGELILLHVVSPVPAEYLGPIWYQGADVIESVKTNMQKSLDKLRNLLPSQSGLKCTIEHLVENAFASDGIIDVAKARGADLIVMGVRKSGIHAQRLAAHMPWATAYEVVSHAECPVLTVKA